MPGRVCLTEEQLRTIVLECNVIYRNAPNVQQGEWARLKVLAHLLKKFNLSFSPEASEGSGPVELVSP